MNLKILMPLVALIIWLASISVNSLAETAYTDYASFPASTAHGLVGPAGHGYQGDVIGSIMVIPSSTSAGSVWLSDGFPNYPTYGSMPIYTTGTLSDLKPFTIPVNMRSHNAGFYITTGASETVLINGRFQ